MINIKLRLLDKLLDLLKELITKRPVASLFCAGSLFVLLSWPNPILLLLSLLEVDLNNEFFIEFSKVNYKNYFFGGLGTILMMLSLAYKFFYTKPKDHIKKIEEHKYDINHQWQHKCKINIIYGDINNIQEYDEKTLFIFSTDDKFSVFKNNPHTVFGSFMNRLTPNDKKIFEKKLEDEKTKKMKLGDCVYLPEVSICDKEEKKFNIGVVAISIVINSKKNKMETIETKPENVMLGFNGVLEIVHKYRLNKVYIPLIGSGKEGLSPELSFLSLLISILENLSKGNMPDINIVIHKRLDNSLAIPVKDMKDIANLALNYCK